MNIQIYSEWQKMLNEYSNIFGEKNRVNIYEYEYIRLKIFEYIQMFEYLLYTAPNNNKQM